MGIIFLVFLAAFTWLMLQALYRRRRYGEWDIGAFEFCTFLLIVDMGFIALGDHCFRRSPAASYCLEGNAIGRLYDGHILIAWGGLLLLMIGFWVYSMLAQGIGLYRYFKDMFGR